MRYILNSAVITGFGTFPYAQISIDEAKKWLNEGAYESTFGYQETCDAFNLIFGTNIKLNRKQVKMVPGDEALVFRLTKRIDNPENKGKIGLDFIMKNHEIGLLRMI